MKPVNIKIRVLGTDEVVYNETTTKSSMVTEAINVAYKNGCYVVIKGITESRKKIELCEPTSIKSEKKTDTAK